MTATDILLSGRIPTGWPKTGWYWCLHHDILLEWCTDINARVQYIIENKASTEQRRRFEMMRPVKGPLSEAVAQAGAAYAKALAACVKAKDAYYKARDAYIKARAACDKTGAAYDKTRAAYAKALDAYYKVWDACYKAIHDNLPALIAQHNREYPRTPWVGPTIFEETRT
jgi:hypothetical protein